MHGTRHVQIPDYLGYDVPLGGCQALGPFSLLGGRMEPPVVLVSVADPRDANVCDEWQ